MKFLKFILLIINFAWLVNEGSLRLVPPVKLNSDDFYSRKLHLLANSDKKKLSDNYNTYSEESGDFDDNIGFFDYDNMDEISNKNLNTSDNDHGNVVDNDHTIGDDFNNYIDTTIMNNRDESDENSIEEDDIFNTNEDDNDNYDIDDDNYNDSDQNPFQINEFYESSSKRAGILKIITVPTDKTFNSYLKYVNQITEYNFGSMPSAKSVLVSKIQIAFNSTQKMDAKMQICYPKSKDMLTVSCPLDSINVLVEQGSNTNNVKIISGELSFLHFKQQVCIEVEMNSTRQYTVTANFYSVLFCDLFL